VFVGHPALGMTDVPAGSIRGFTFKPTLHVNYGEKVMNVRDGLPKFKDFPKDFGGSGETLAERSRLEKGPGPFFTRRAGGGRPQARSRAGAGAPGRVRACAAGTPCARAPCASGALRSAPTPRAGSGGASPPCPRAA